HRGFHPDAVGDLRAHHLFTEERGGGVVRAEHPGQRQAVVVAADRERQLGRRVPLDEEDLGRSRTGKLPVELELIHVLGQVREGVIKVPVLVPVHQDFVEKCSLGSGDRGLGRFPSVRLHYASIRVKVTSRYGNLGEVVLIWSMRTSGAAQPTSKSVAEAPTSTCGAAIASVVSSGSASVPTPIENRQATAPAGGWTFVNVARLQAPSVTLNVLDVEAGVPDTGARDASNHSNRRVEPVTL